MQLGQQKMQYDRAKTIFSPDGRLFQVEYAREAVKRGATALGIVFEDGVLLAAIRNDVDLQPRNPGKVFEIDNHLGVANSGLVADGRVLVDEARKEAQKNEMTYGEPIQTEVLARFVADRKQMYTQYGGVRPYGIAMLVGGVKEGKPRVFHTDPSGILQEWKAIAIGKDSEKKNEIFEEEYEEGMDEEEAIDMAAKVLSKEEEDFGLENIEMAIIREEKDFKRLLKEDLEEFGVEV